MNFILRFTIWTALWGLVGFAVGALVVDISWPRQYGSLAVAIVVASGAMIGALGAITQELSSALRDGK